MKQAYTIPEARREVVNGLVTRVQKKAARYGAEVTFEFGKPYAKQFPVLDTSGVKGMALVEVFDLTIDGDEIRKGGYTVVAEVEHLKDGNVVNAFGGGDIKPAWYQSDCRCEHCNTNRDRRVTFIVRREDGMEKQIGRQCLKDYCGIDPQAIGCRNEIHEILLNEDIADCDFNERRIERVYDAVEALAVAIRTVREQGYVKSGEPGCNKDRIANAIRNTSVSEDERAEAEEMAHGIAQMDEDEARAALLGNAQAIIRSGYCKANHFGWIAYAPVAYKKYLDEQNRGAERESDYVGRIGERIEVEVAQMALLTSWINQWGETFLYRIIDRNGNVLVWFASKQIGDGEVMRIKATVRDHAERDGIRQTVVTRCKVA